VCVEVAQYISPPNQKIFIQNQLKWLWFYFEPCIYCLIETFITMVPQNITFNSTWISLPISSLKRWKLEKGENIVRLNRNRMRLANFCMLFFLSIFNFLNKMFLIFTLCFLAKETLHIFNL